MLIFFFNVHSITPKGWPFRILSQDIQNLNLKHCCLETKTLWTILQLYWLFMITGTLKIQKGFSTIYLLICNVICYFSKYCKYLQNSWYVSSLVICECVSYCAYFINVNKLYVHVCVLERAKHRFFALPNPLSCSLMNEICLNISLFLTLHNPYLDELQLECL